MSIFLIINLLCEKVDGFLRYNVGISESNESARCCIIVLVDDMWDCSRYVASCFL